LRVLTVQELTRHIKMLLEKDYLLANVWVRGEVSNFKPASSGHFYFTLKDDCSSLKVVMFRSRSRLVPFRLENGMAVTIRGYISLYERDGIYQLYGQEIEPDGTGALYLAFEQLKARLQKEGLFDPKHKKELPLLPRRIGLVTSPTGAAVRDLMKIIQRRWPGLHLVLVPVPVQGDTAPPAIARAIDLLNRVGGIELIIVGRGGGSLEEIWAFNTEIVARSIFRSTVPVISAVGHETDFTISDFVADMRASTPSAAAVLAVPDTREMARRLVTLKSRLAQALRESALRSRRRLDNCLAHRVFAHPRDILCGSRQQSLDQLHRRLVQSIQGVIERKGGSLAILAGQLQALSPLATLARGYSICTTPDGRKVIRDAESVKKGDRLSVLLLRGKLQCLVEDKTT